MKLSNSTSDASFAGISHPYRISAQKVDNYIKCFSLYNFNSEKDGKKAWLPYTSYIRISDKNEALSVYFEKSFLDNPLIFIHYKPESGKIILKNYMDIEQASVFEDSQKLEVFVTELCKPIKIEKLLAGIEDISKLSKTFSAIKDFYKKQDSELFEIELDYSPDI